mmetsp:Transcript_51/g.123  ORF Transcript_51/g.123 Transcript_51/m.123 type:complete len:378 (-) Transcript_51:4760-5893(-)
MASQLGFIRLDALEDHRRHQLQVARTHLFLKCLLQFAVVDHGHVGAREEIGHERVEERHILRNELGRVHVANRAKQDDILGQFWIGPLERTSLVQHRLDRAQAEVVMVLLGELLHHQVVKGVHLLGEDLGRGEAFSIEHNLDDERDVRRHHRHWTEQRLQVLGKFGPSGVAWIHRDENATRRIQLNVLALKHETGPLLGHRSQDAEDLLRHHREHLNLNAVELIEARPCSCLCKTREHAPKRLVVEAVRAIEDDAVFGQILGEVLDGLRLACTGRPLREPTAMQVQRRCERGVAPIRQWRDDKAPGIADVLIAEPMRCVGLADNAFLGSSFPIEAQLQQPFEVVHGGTASLHHLVNDLTRVHLDREDVDNLLAIELA